MERRIEKFRLVLEMPLHDVNEDNNKKHPRAIPPHNSHGREEDSIQNFCRLVPHLGTKDVRKYLQLDT